MSTFVFFKHTVLNLALGGLASLLVLVSIGDYTHIYTCVCMAIFVMTFMQSLALTFTTKSLTLILSLTLKVL